MTNLGPNRDFFLRLKEFHEVYKLLPMLFVIFSFLVKLLSLFLQWEMVEHFAWACRMSVISIEEGIRCCSVIESEKYESLIRYLKILWRFSHLNIAFYNFLGNYWQISIPDVEQFSFIGNIPDRVIFPVYEIFLVSCESNSNLDYTQGHPPPVGKS